MDQSTFDKLERLAKLRADGALNDAEYEGQKAKLLAERPNPAVMSGATERVPEPLIDEHKLAPIWRARFQLIDQHGMPNTRAYSDAMRNIGFWERIRHIMSPLAFLLGPFYFLFLGLWRPALSLTGAVIAYSLVLDALHISESFDRVTWIPPAVAFAWTCIPLYYLRVRRGVHSWNPMIWWRGVRN